MNRDFIVPGGAKGELCLSAHGYWNPVNWTSVYLSETNQFESVSGGFRCKKSGKYIVVAFATGYASYTEKTVSITVNGDVKYSGKESKYSGAQTHGEVELTEGDTINVTITYEGVHCASIVAFYV